MKNRTTSEAFTTAMLNPAAKCQRAGTSRKDKPTVRAVSTSNATSTAICECGINFLADAATLAGIACFPVAKSLWNLRMQYDDPRWEQIRYRSLEYRNHN